MLGAIEGGMGIVHELTFDDYRQSFIARKAVERCVEIVSEASKYLPAELKDRHSGIYWDEIRAIGNLLRHEYQRVDDLVMWRIATKYFPDLRVVVVDLVHQTENSQD